LRRACGFQRPRRLVEKQHVGAVHQRTRDREPLRLAAGELLGPGRGRAGQADYLQHLVGALERETVEIGERAQLLARGEPLEERRRLQLNADPG
jgi:hypothetical protein